MTEYNAQVLTIYGVFFILMQFKSTQASSLRNDFNANIQYRYLPRLTPMNQEYISSFADSNELYRNIGYHERRTVDSESDVEFSPILVDLLNTMGNVQSPLRNVKTHPHPYYSKYWPWGPWHWDKKYKTKRMYYPSSTLRHTPLYTMNMKVNMNNPWNTWKTQESSQIHYPRQSQNLQEITPISHSWSTQNSQTIKRINHKPSTSIQFPWNTWKIQESSGLHYPRNFEKSIPIFYPSSTRYAPSKTFTQYPCNTRINCPWNTETALNRRYRYYPWGARSDKPSIPTWGPPAWPLNGWMQKKDGLSTYGCTMVGCYMSMGLKTIKLK